MKIVKLEAENIKRLKAVSIEPNGNLVVIGGNNGEGKSSTIDSIAYALGGKGAICDEPIHRGEEKAKIVCDLDDLIVTRTFTKRGGQLKVSTKDGASYSSPQGMLDALVGKLSFDPLAFATMDPKPRLETLKQLVGLDFAKLDAKRKSIFDARTEVNRDGKSLKARFDEMTKYPDAPEEEIKVADLMKTLEERQKVNKENNGQREDLDSLEETISEQKEGLAALEEQLELTKVKIQNTKDQIVVYENDHRKLADQVAKLQDADEQEIKDQIKNAENVNAEVRSNAERADLEKLLESKRQESQDLTDKLTAIDKEKANTLAAAEFPVDGLSFDGTGVTYGGIPFDQASDAEKLRVSVAMGLAMNPKLKVLLIRNGSLLDEKNLKTVAEIAAEADAQVWMERVGQGKECQIIIEDGMVKK